MIYILLGVYVNTIHLFETVEADEPLPDLSKWAFAGIVIVVYTVVIAVVISFIFLLRRFIRGRRKTNTNQNKSDQVFCSVSNSKQHVQSPPASGSNDVNHYSTPDDKQIQDQTGGYATPAEPASPYAVTGASPYEEAGVSRKGKQPGHVSSLNQEYNRLGYNPAFKTKGELPQNHYDHANTETGAYSTVHAEARKQDQLREMAAVQYSHLQRNDDVI
ncbi:uncharacterized protein [Littorina saxatilis]|uniref:Uncharacterized protein n=1 Tax=Littorina saxatilis TaxID=31220 RepID=A0AAN9G8L6_9CAEN